MPEFTNRHSTGPDYIDNMFQKEIFIRVRYAETDQMGYVYYGNYATYYEVARTEALRIAGFHYKKMEDDGVMLPVLESKSKYIAPAKYDELLTIAVKIIKEPSVKITFNYDIYNESKVLIHQGETTLVFVKVETASPCRPPKYLIELLKPYFS